MRSSTSSWPPLHRRSLNPSQRAALAIRYEKYRQAQEQARLRKLANLKGSADVAALPHRGERSRELAAELAGVSPRLIQDALRLQRENPALFEQVQAGPLTASRAIKELERRQRQAGLSPAPPLPAGLFDLIYADPPWPSPSPCSTWSAEQHYETMALEEIKALRVPAAEDCALFLWVLNGQLEEGLEVMRAWGFTYKSCLVWVKPSIGLGQYIRSRHELLLFGIRGNMGVPDPADRPDSVIEAPRGRHSEKPDEAYERIERMYPAAQRRLELFARKARAGWTAWGNEVAA